MAKYIIAELAYNLARKSDCYSDFRRSMADLTSLKELLKDVPAADVVEVKHGEWITPTKIKGMNIAVPHCSLCGNVPCDKALYCPYRGAKMDRKGG